MEVKVQMFPTEAGRSPRLPEYQTGGSAAVDLEANLDRPLRIEAGGRADVRTGVAIELPGEEYAAFLFARSGLSAKRGLTLVNGVGVIDSDYRGEIVVALWNVSGTEQEIKPGERIAQAVVMRVEQASFLAADRLSETPRGDGAFGSTGR